MYSVNNSSDSTSDISSLADSGDIGNGDEDDGKSCKICYGADKSAGNDWVSPCRCSGSIKWVHNKCLLRWTETAPYIHQHMCNMCRYEYRRYWRLKSPKHWTWPKLHITLWDSVEILLDIYTTAKLIRNTTAVIQGTKSVPAQMFYFLIWKMFIVTNHRIQYYKGLCLTILGSIFEPRIQNAILGK